MVLKLIAGLAFSMLVGAATAAIVVGLWRLATS
jgi:hypothetical protein